LLLLLTCAPVAAQENSADASDQGEIKPPADVPEDTPGEPSKTETPTKSTHEFGGPDSVDTQLEKDAEEKEPLLRLDFLKPYTEFKERVHDEIGLSFGGDYTFVYFAATDSVGKDEAASGMARIYGAWELLGRGSDNPGKLVYKVEHRHRATGIATNQLSSELGNVGLIEPPFSNEQERLTNLYWRQNFLKDRIVVLAGFLDATDYVDAYALASPWLHFANFAFSTGSATIGLPGDAALGAAGGIWVTDNVYVLAGATDLNSDPHDPFDDLFADFELFKSLEVGWTTSPERAYLDNVHVTFWHSDEREEGQVSDGWGLNFSASYWFHDTWLPFLRAGYAKDGGSLLEASVSAGVGYQPVAGRDLLGFALNWGKPNEDTFGGDLDDQLAAELFYRVQIVEHLQITPSVQLLVNPALNPDDDVLAVFGIRARVSF
jgi:porin